MKDEKGFTLIEVIIAVLLMGIIGAALLGGLSGASKALVNADEQATAESLARSQMEYVKTLPYDISGTPSYSPAIPQEHTDVGYTADIVATLIMPDLQKITITIDHNTNLGIIILEGYKANR